MRRVVVIVATLAVASCGRDPILEAAEKQREAAQADAAAARTQAGPSPGTPAEPTPGQPGAPAPGTPAAAPAPGTPGETAPGLSGDPRPGVPAEPTPGIPEEPAPGIPGSPQPGAGATVTLAGTVVYPAWTTGTVRVTAFDRDHGKPSGTPPRVVGAAQIDRPGAFTLSVPEDFGKVYLEAAVDEDGDGRPGPLDPQGQADRYPVTVGDDPVSGLEITLKKRPPPPGGVKEEY